MSSQLNKKLVLEIFTFTMLRYAWEKNTKQRKQPKRNELSVILCLLISLLRYSMNCQKLS
ncbi:CLUMA_CG002056, isoform A [Clunio marinus]|uniref:CLUMA_CG002056, isoform A n=1 Tax=Clunio marinus TaxID=568069 RepID=A0A1J1HLI9_9DIPT|nr:CLUMA_CG002056, isoform A [Clunio marinus]